MEQTAVVATEARARMGGEVHGKEAGNAVLSLFCKESAGKVLEAIIISEIVDLVVVKVLGSVGVDSKCRCCSSALRLAICCPWFLMDMLQVRDEQFGAFVAQSGLRPLVFSI